MNRKIAVGPLVRNKHKTADHNGNGMSDLPERLREGWIHMQQSKRIDTRYEAADELERLRQVVERIEAKLEDALHEPAERYMTIRRAAQYCGLSEKAMYRLRVVQVRIGGAVRVDRVKLEKYVNRERL